MSLFIASLNSGSNGNCYYIGNGHEAVLIDAGISCRETEKRMKRLGLSMQKVKAVFITHEHTDHIKGMQGIATKHQVPVYITAPTLHRSHIILGNHLVKSFIANEPVNIGGLTIKAFTKLHDAADPHSFVVSGDGINIGVFTDIGTPCENLVKYFKECHAAFLEANYDDAMLEQGTYPTHLKNRIRGGNGHLSNRQAFELFTAHRPAHMSHLFLSHLSKNNNTPELVSKLFRRFAKDMNIVIASRNEESSVYEVHNKPLDTNKGKKIPGRHAKQATLF